MPGLDGALDATPSLPQPLYHQIYLVLREQLMENSFPLNQPIPGEHELAERFEVSRVTIRRALSVLEREGLILRQRGRGTFPVANAATDGFPPSSHPTMAGLISNLSMFGRTTSARVIERKVVIPESAILEAMRLSPESPVCRIVRVRHDATGPYCHVTTYLEAELALGIDWAPLDHLPVLTLIERSGHLLQSADQTLSAQVTDEATGKLLDLAPGTALLAMTRTSFDSRGRILEYSHALYRPDRYAYAMSLGSIDGKRAPRWVPIASAAD